MIVDRSNKQSATAAKLAVLMWAFAAVTMCLIGITVYAQSSAPVSGVKVGDKIPSIATVDQSGHPQTFESLRGQHGLLLLFSRSADWCPYCKRHLMELQQAKPEFEAKGIHVASITYDSVEILKDFSERKGITYPMLSDTNSKIIRAFGILNPEGKGFTAGIPYPGIYYISPDGVIEKRYFESQYSDRFTPNEIYSDIFGVTPLVASETTPIVAKHATVKLSQSDMTAGAGNRLRLLVQIEPAPHVHLYAPGAEKDGYKVVKLEVKPSADYHSEPLHYPPSTLLAFPQLKEAVPVYSRATVLTEDVVIAASKAFNASIGTGKNIEINGTLLYQACDDHQCFLPVELSVSWVVHIQPLDLVRSPEGLQHKE